MSEPTMQELFALKEKYDNDEPLNLDFVKDEDFEEYFDEKFNEFFKPTKEKAEKLVGKCFISSTGDELVKVLAIQTKPRHEGYPIETGEFIYEKLYKNRKGHWHFKDYIWLQQDYNDKYAYLRLTPYAELNYASESMYHIGNDGLLYVDYCCDGICTPFVEANAGMFDEAREEAVKAAEKDAEELNG